MDMKQHEVSWTGYLLKTVSMAIEDLCKRGKTGGRMDWSNLNSNCQVDSSTSVREFDRFCKAQTRLACHKQHCIPVSLIL